jgi:hypothetical protein
MLLRELLLVAAVTMLVLLMEEPSLGPADLPMQVSAPYRLQDPQEYSTSGADINSTSREILLHHTAPKLFCLHLLLSSKSHLLLSELLVMKLDQEGKSASTSKWCPP